MVRESEMFIKHKAQDREQSEWYIRCVTKATMTASRNMQFFDYVKLTTSHILVLKIILILLLV